MADPEQIYQEVLQEEQGKGVSGAVAEGRAKAARARAEVGSPHPKEPKWWPGAQPHLEGEEAPAATEEAAPEAAEEPAPEPAEEAAAPAAEEAAPAEEPTPEAAPAAAEAEAEAEAPAATEEKQAPEAAPEQPAAPAPAPTAEPAAPAAASQAAAAQAQAPAPATSAQTAAASAQTTGVLHGTTTGMRLRPEDEVTTESQFEGQAAMYERRKLIDDLVATGVPAVSAAGTGRARSPWLALLYLVIPLLVIGYLAAQDDGSAETEAAAETGAEAPNGGGGAPTEITAADLEWSTDALTFAADKPIELPVTNEDTTVHNLSIYPTEEDAIAEQKVIFDGADVDGGDSVTYEIDPLKPDTYTFICDYHTNMIGDFVVE